MKRLFQIVGIAAALALSSGGIASAQDVLDRTDPLIVESETTEDDDPKPPKSSPVVTEAAPTDATPATTSAVQVGAVRLVGLETLTEADFMAVIAPVLGTTLDADGQRALVEAIAARLHALGYPLGVAMIEPQGIAAGVLHVRVDQGHIDAVRIEADTNGLVDRMMAPLANGQPVTGAELQRAILLAEAVPGVHLSRARVNQEAALSVLSFRLHEDPTDARIVVDNWGSDTLGPVKLRARLEQRGVLTDGDELTPYVVTTPSDPSEYIYASVSYTSPLDKNGTRLGISGSVARIDAMSANSGRELHGEGERIKVWVENPVVLTPNARVEASVGASFRDTRQSRDGIRSREDRVTALNARLYGSFRLEDVRAYGRVEVVRGTGWFDATREGDPLASRDDGDSRFTLVEASGSVIAPIGGPLSVRVDGRAQVASRPLLSGEEFGFGGPSFGRGYYFREASGDNAVAGAVEVRLDIPRVLEGIQVYGYGDAARLWDLRGGEKRSLATAGGGIRAQVTRRLGFGVETGVPLDRDYDPRINFETWIRF